MTMRSLGAVALLSVVLSSAASAQAPLTVQEKIINARSAAPASLSAEATVMDWPETEGGDFVVLEEGTNGWTCLPDMPFTDGNDPECADEMWMEFYRAFKAGTEPEYTRIGLSYMIAPGGSSSSNTDPSATGPTPDNEWGFDPPHLMIVLPDAGDLEGLPTSRGTGGPWVMYPGTPYAHIMVPIEDKPVGKR
jgi:hypothetical protein